MTVVEDTEIAKYLIISFPSFVEICIIYLKKNRKANLPVPCSLVTKEYHKALVMKALWSETQNSLSLQEQFHKGYNEEPVK